jgi:hypothetical protein
VEQTISQHLKLKKFLKKNLGNTNLWVNPYLNQDPIPLDLSLHQELTLHQAKETVADLNIVNLTMDNPITAGVLTLNLNLNICSNLGFQAQCYLYKLRPATGLLPNLPLSKAT